MRLCEACERVISEGWRCEYDDTYYCNMKCIATSMNPRCYNRLLKEKTLYWTVCKNEEEK
ncbi:hypothetical protein [Bacillus rhizoplanae]|uniref:hypothetical protein n=1 Tax=Bacillus rhizoplanae TaxID=2880966 RepID=UPI003D1CF2A2